MVGTLAVQLGTGSSRRARRLSTNLVLGVYSTLVTLALLYVSFGRSSSGGQHGWQRLGLFNMGPSAAAGTAAPTAASHHLAARSAPAAAGTDLQHQASAGGASPQQAASGGGSRTQPGRPHLRWFRPHGYELPEECYKHESLYANVLDNLRPWRGRGIYKTDLDACAPVAARAIEGLQKYQFRLLVWDGDVVITSGGLRRAPAGSLNAERWQEGLEYYAIRQVQDAARRFGLPKMEFAVGFGDLSRIEGLKNGSLCPLMVYCKRPEHYDILIPSGHFTQYMYDQWVEQQLADGGGPHWEDKEEKAIGRWSDYCAYVPQGDRHGCATACLRGTYANYSRDTPGSLTVFHGPRMPLSEQRRFKYSFHLDGLGCSTRLQKVLATGQTVIKQDSNLTEWYYSALRPWVHFVPSGWNGLAEVEWAVQFLRDHDELARAIGRNSQRFAQDHLTEEGRLCYIKVLFEEMRKLMRYEPRLEDFPHRITFDEEMRLYTDPQHNLHLKIRKQP